MSQAMNVRVLGDSGKQPRTQKARGVKALLTTHNTGHYHISDLQGTPQEIHQLWQYLESKFYSREIFARPCPLKPRHGFVESRVITNEAELTAILTETYTADPKGEMLYVHKLDYPYSAVVTDTSFAIGPGHDGATAGKQAYTLDINCDLRKWADQTHMKFYAPAKGYNRSIKPSSYAGLKPQSRMPFVEFVGQTPVQLRYGPRLDSYSGNWIPPEGTTATKVLQANWFSGDMMHLEKELKDYLNKYGPYDLAVNAKGYSLSSHLAIQCISKGIAVFTTQEPCKMRGNPKQTPEGPLPTTLQPRMAAQKPWAKPNLTEAIALVQALAASPVSEQRSILLYLASELILRAAIGACIAEHRYFRVEDFGELPTGPITAADKPLQFPAKIPARSAFYTKALKANLRDYKKSLHYLGQLTVCERDFRNGMWPSNFGGVKWANCAKATNDALQAWLAVHSYSLYKTDKYVGWHAHNQAINELVGAMNILINVSHNSGKCLTKFVNSDILNSITLLPAKHLITEHIYTTLATLNQEATNGSTAAPTSAALS